MRGAVLAVCLAAAAAGVQEAPLLTVLPREEWLRQLEVRADLHMIHKEYLDAVDAYGEALRLAPRNPSLLNKTGIAYHQLLRLDDAKKYYERALRADNGYAQAWNNLGTIYYSRKEYRKAIRNYRKALERNPNLAAVHSNLGAAHFALKEYDEALAEFQNALRIDPEVFVQRNPFGGVLQNISGEDRARFYYLVAKSYAALGDAELCVRFLRRALETGYPAAQAQADPAFNPVREDAGFQALFSEPVPVLPR